MKQQNDSGGSAPELQLPFWKKTTDKHTGMSKWKLVMQPDLYGEITVFPVLRNDRMMFHLHDEHRWALSDFLGDGEFFDTLEDAQRAGNVVYEKLLEDQTKFPKELKCGMIFLITENQMYRDGKELMLILNCESKVWRVAKSQWICEQWSGFQVPKEEEGTGLFEEEDILNWRWGRLRYCGMMPTLAQLEEAAR